MLRFFLLKPIQVSPLSVVVYAWLVHTAPAFALQPSAP
jgi:hypothetical protein